MVSTVRNADVFVGALPEDMPPFDCANGSIFFDMTTGKSYFFMADVGVWYEPISGSEIENPYDDGDSEPGGGGK